MISTLSIPTAFVTGGIQCWVFIRAWVSGIPTPHTRLTISGSFPFPLWLWLVAWTALCLLTSLTGQHVWLHWRLWDFWHCRHLAARAVVRVQPPSSEWLFHLLKAELCICLEFLQHCHISYPPLRVSLITSLLWRFCTHKFRSNCRDKLILTVLYFCPQFGLSGWTMHVRR